MTVITGPGGPADEVVRYAAGVGGFVYCNPSYNFNLAHANQASVVDARLDKRPGGVLGGAKLFDPGALADRCEPVGSLWVDDGDTLTGTLNWRTGDLYWRGKKATLTLPGPPLGGIRLVDIGDEPDGLEMVRKYRLVCATANLYTLKCRQAKKDVFEADTGEVWEEVLSYQPTSPPEGYFWDELIISPAADEVAQTIRFYDFEEPWHVEKRLERAYAQTFSYNPANNAVGAAVEWDLADLMTSQRTDRATYTGVWESIPLDNEYNISVLGYAWLHYAPDGDLKALRVTHASTTTQTGIVTATGGGTSVSADVTQTCDWRLQAHKVTVKTLAEELILEKAWTNTIEVEDTDSTTGTTHPIIGSLTGPIYAMSALVYYDPVNDVIVVGERRYDTLGAMAFGGFPLAGPSSYNVAACECSGQYVICERFFGRMSATIGAGSGDNIEIVERAEIYARGALWHEVEDSQVMGDTTWDPMLLNLLSDNNNLYGAGQLGWATDRTFDGLSYSLECECLQCDENMENCVPIADCDVSPAIEITLKDGLLQVAGSAAIDRNASAIGADGAVAQETEIGDVDFGDGDWHGEWRFDGLGIRPFQLNEPPPWRWLTPVGEDYSAIDPDFSVQSKLVSFIARGDEEWLSP